MDSAGVRAAIRDGSANRDTWLWRKGLAEWQRAGEAPDFADAFPAAQPPDLDQGADQDTLSAHPVVEYASIPVVSSAHVAGSASVHRGSGFQTDQRAIPMPIIRANNLAQESDSPVADRRPPGGAQRTSQPLGAARPAGAPNRSSVGETAARAGDPVRPAARLEAAAGHPSRPDSESRTAALDVVTPTDREDSDRDSKRCSPATDTDTGQRARMTWRVDEGDRDSAIAWADEQKRMQAGILDLARQLRGWQRVGVAALVCVAVVLMVALAIAYQYRQAQDAAEKCAAGAKSAPEPTDQANVKPKVEEVAAKPASPCEGKAEDAIAGFNNGNFKSAGTTFALMATNCADEAKAVEEREAGLRLAMRFAKLFDGPAREQLSEANSILMAVTHSSKISPSASAALKTALQDWICQNKTVFKEYAACMNVALPEGADAVTKNQTLRDATGACVLVAELGQACKDSALASAKENPNLAALRSSLEADLASEVKVYLAKIAKIVPPCEGAAKKAAAVQDKWAPYVMAGDRNASIRMILEQRGFNQKVTKSREQLDEIESKVQELKWPDVSKKQFEVALESARKRCDFKQ